MQTMNVLLRIGGDLRMTVPVKGVTPAEALLLAHFHDPDTHDVFENPQITDDVERAKLDERKRLIDKYPQYEKLTMELFPGRNATDIPELFSELEGLPVEFPAAHHAKPARKHAEPAAEESIDVAKVFGATGTDEPMAPIEPLVKGPDPDAPRVARKGK